MSLDLQKISFTVDTTQLDTAATKLAALGKAASGLAVDLKKMDKASADAAVNQKKVELAAEKVATQAAKTAAVTEQSELKKQKAIKGTTQAVEQAQVAQLGLVEGIERKRDLISEGWTRGESSVLKMAEAMGIAGGEMERLKGLLRDIGGLSSNPFDSTLGSLRSIQKEFDGLVLRSKLVAQGIELNSTQLKQFARIAAEASVAVKKMGMDPTEGAGLEMYNKLLTESQDAYLKVAVANKTMLDGEKLLAKQHRDTASAKNFLIKEDERMVSVMEQLNTGTNRSVSISEKAAIATANYARALKTAGVAGDEAKNKLAKYSAAQQLASQKEEQRAAANLARALQPQATDVVVSLWSGQNPLTVMLQQGGQVVDLFKLSGVEANKLGETMKKAFTGMLPSIVAVGKALGGLLVDGLIGAGSAISGFIAQITMMDKVMEAGKRRMASMGEDGFKYIKWLNNLGKVMTALAGGAFLILIAAVVGLGVAFNQVRKENDELTKSLALSGGMIGISQVQALQYVDSLSKIGVTTGTATKVISEMAKTSSLTSESIMMVAKSAQNLYSYADVAIEDTVKAYAKLKDEPVKALLELAKATGLVSPEVIKLAISLEEQGKKSEAAALAMKTYAEVTDNQIAKMRENYNSFTLAIIEMGKRIKTFFSESFKVLFLATDPNKAIEAQVSKTTKALADIRKTNAFKGGVVSVVGEAERLEKVLEQLYKQIDAQDKLTAQAATTEQANAKNAGFQAEIARLKEQSLLAEDKALIERNRLEGVKTEAIKAAAKVNKEVAKEDLAYLDSAIAKQNKIISDAKKKSPKVKVDHDTRELVNYVKSVKERVSDLGIEVQGVAQETTKADKLWKDLSNDKLWGKISQELKNELRGLLDITSQQEILNKKKAEEKKLLEEIVKISNDNDKFILNETQESQKLNDSLQLRLDLIGKTVEEQKKIKDAYEQSVKLSALDAKFADQRLKVEQEFKKLKDKPNADSNFIQIESNRVIELLKLELKYQDSRKTLSKEAGVIIAEDFYSEMKKISTPIANALSDALLKGGEGAFDDMWKTLQNEFINKPFKIKLEGIVDQVTAFLGGKNGESGKADEYLSKLSSMLGGSGGLNTGSFFANGNKMTGTEKMGGFMSYAEALGNAKDGSWGKAIGQGIGTYFFGSFGGQIGKALGGVVDKWFSKEYVASTGDSARVYDANGNVTSAQKMSGVFTNNASADSVVDALQKQYADTAKALGIGTIATQFIYGGNNSDGGKFALGGGAGTVSTYQGETKSTPEALQLASARAVFAALQGSALPKYLAGIFDGMTAGSMTSAEIDAAIKGAEVFKALNETLTQMPFEGLSDLSYKAMSNLIEFAGGLDSLQNSLGGFYQNFYSDQEKIANSTKYLTSQFSSLGVVMPAVNEDMRTWYRTEVERALALDQSIPANAKLTAGLLAMQGAVNDLAPVAEEVVVSLEKQTEWQRKLDVLTGKTTQRELEKIDALADADKATRDIILEFYAYEDAQIAAAAATELTKKALEALQTETQKAMTDMVTLWGDLTGAMKEIDKPAATLVEQWRANSAELQTLTQGLADALGELPEESALDKLKNVLSALASATGGIADLNNQIFELKVGQGGANAVGLLQDKERSLYAEMQTSNDPGAVAAKLASTTISRIKLQAEIQEESLVNIAKLEKENRDKQIEALQKQISAAETLVDVVGGLKNYIAELKFGDLSALNPTDQLSTARSLFESTLAGAQGGDAKAMQNLQGYSSSYLQEAQGYYGGATSEYASIFQSVTGLLDEFSTTPITDIELLTSQLEKLQLIADSSTALQTVTTDTSALQITSLTEIRDALSEREQQLQKQADDAKVVAQAQIDALKEIVAGQESQIKQHAAEYEVLNTKLTDIGKSLESIDATNKQVAAST